MIVPYEQDPSHAPAVSANVPDIPHTCGRGRCAVIAWPHPPARMQRLAGRAPAVLLAAALAPLPAHAEVRPLTPGGGDPRVQSAAFRSTVFATGLHYPYGMALLRDGSLLVGTTRPDAGGSY